MESQSEFNDRLLSLGLARVSEAAAIAATEFVGGGDEKAADQAAVDAMREQLNMLDINGTIVIGEGERDEAPMLFIGEKVGSGKGPGVDIALDPLEGTNLTAKDMPNALTVIAMGARGSLLHAPDVYMEKLAYGPGYEPNLITPDKSIDTDVLYDLLKCVIPHEVEREHFLDWIAYQYQNPGEKIRYALIMQSDEFQLGKGC